MKHPAPLFLIGFTCLALPLSSPSLRAQPSAGTPEERLQQGLRDLRVYDVPQALRRWFADSPLAADDKGLVIVQNELEKTLASYGKIEAAEVLSDREIGAHTRRFYFTLLCERGPIFCSADAYSSKRGWLLTDFQFHTKAGKVFPESMLEP